MPIFNVFPVIWFFVNFFGNLFVHDSNNHISVARESGRNLEAMEELDTENKGIMATQLNQIKRWFLSHSQHLNFLTILLLASVSMDFVTFPIQLVTSINGIA